MANSLNDKYKEPAVTIKLMYTDDGVMVEEYSFDGYELYDAIKNASDEYLESLQNS